MAISPGTRFGSYEIVEPIGSGGMGEVYRARDTALGRDVALKVLPASFSNDAMRVARFEQEAKTLASLNHANIAHIYGLERADGSTGIAMELVDGQTLVDRIAEGPIPVADALRIAGQIADALEAAHERAIVHRDLKPGNVKIKPDGTVKVLDFGIAKALDPRFLTGPGPAALTTPAMTEAGFILGTAAYMSPEQARGKFVDQRTDVWAFGCVLFEMLTGKPAFLGEDVTSTLARVLETPAKLDALPTGVPPAVRRTLELCLEKDARKRIADMRDVKLALAGTFATGAPARPISRLKLPVAVGAAALLAGAAGWLLRPAPPAARSDSAPTLPVSRFVITPPATAPLASLGGAQVAISPDGKRIAYFAEKPENGNVELYVRELDALEARPIPGAEGRSVGNMNLFFSADGKSIGYFAPDRGGVISVTIDGRPSVKIVDGPSTFLGGTWAPDNTIIYSSATLLERVSAGGGGTPEPLMPQRQGGLVAGPVLLPGGRAVLFHAIEGGNDFVDVLDLETGKAKRLVEGGANPFYADSGHIVFARGTTLMAVPFKASELAVTGEPVALIQGVRRTPGGAAHFGLSATGTLVYEPTTDDSRSEALSAVVWVDRKGAVVERALNDLVTNPRDPRLSPDGTRLLLVTGAFSDGDLWSYDLGGRPPIPVALPGDNRFPVWSPDSRQVAFAKIQGFPELFTVPADGSVLTPQSLRGPMPVGVPYVWSSAGELILTRRTGSSDIVAIPASSAGEARKVVASEFTEYDPALSPNGRWLAYVSDRTGVGEIWVQGYPDGVPVRVSRNGGYEPLWSRDGRELFYWQGNAMMAAAVKTDDTFTFSTPVQLFSGRYLTIPSDEARSYDVARDGRFLLILPGNESTAAAPRSIIVVQNFSEELKQRVRPSGK
jgi:serine/threonine-protein kinase